MVRTKPGDERRRRKLFTFGWIVLLFVLISGLIYWEQTALLYILATLGVTALLIVVAIADLGGQESITGSPESNDAATGDGKGGRPFSGTQSPQT